MKQRMKQRMKAINDVTGKKFCLLKSVKKKLQLGNAYFKAQSTSNILLMGKDLKMGLGAPGWLT